MTESRDPKSRDGEPDTPDMIDGAHDYATWDARQATWDNSVMPSNPPPGRPVGPDWAPPNGWDPRAWSPAPRGWQFRTSIVLSVVLLVVLVAGYALRAMAVHQIEKTLQQWNATWNTPNDLAARDRLQCAAQQFPITSSGPVQTNIRSELHTDAVSVAPALSTAYAKVTISETYTGPDPVYHGAYNEVMSQGQPYPYKFGFEMVKEAGSWKVCDWGGSAVIQKSRTVLLGWKLLGPP